MTGIAPRFRWAAGAAGGEAPLRGRDDLVAFFEAGERRDGQQLIGVELERVPLLADGRAAPHRGEEATVEALLAFVAARAGWTPVHQDGGLVGLSAPLGQVHLEPGAQVELALAPRRTAREVLHDLRTWQELLRAGAAATGVHAAAIGFQPVTAIPRIEWVAKDRYRVMRDHLGARGRLAHHMMKGTAGVQFTVDHAGEEEAARLVRTALAVGPLVHALVVNSPLEEGRPTGWLSRRPDVWRHVDPDRCGPLHWVHDAEGFTYARYARWALAAPVMFVVRDGAWTAIGDRTFEQFLAQGHPAAGPARHEDWALHLTTLFPDVRVKQQIEIRGADSCGIELNAALAALWRGLLYDETVGAEADALTRTWTDAERDALVTDAARRGPAAEVRGRGVRELASEVLDLAERGLDAGDAVLLAPLRRIADGAPSPAEELLAAHARDGAAALLARV